MGKEERTPLSLGKILDPPLQICGQAAAFHMNFLALWVEMSMHTRCTDRVDACFLQGSSTRHVVSRQCPGEQPDFRDGMQTQRTCPQAYPHFEMCGDRARGESRGRFGKKIYYAPP